MGKSPRHLLGLQGLGDRAMADIVARAETIQARGARPVCAGQQAVLAFFEPSTRTSTSFALAFQRLGGQVVMLNVAQSSAQKGETLHDSLSTLLAMQPHFLVLRHGQNGGLQPLAAATETSVVNAGDGAGEHPTQALLDALTVKQIKGRLNDLTVAIVGDIRHSRVARSNAHLWRQMGSRVVMVAPPELLPDVDDYPFAFFSTDMAQGLKKADVIITLRLQKERLEKQLTISADDYHIRYGMDHEKLSYAAPDAVVLHPGPMNRGVEISSTLADDATRCAVLRQVTNGVATRMAVFEWLTHAA